MCDEAVIGLSDQLRTHTKVDVYVETTDAEGDKSLLGALVSNSDSDGYNSEASKDDEEMLVDVPFIYHLSNLDDEREEAR